MDVKLILNELKKWVSEKKFIIFIAINLLLTVGLALVIKYNGKENLPANALDFAYSALGLIGNIVVILTIIYAGEMIPREFSQGTIKQLMIRPYSRTSILLSKYITVLILGLIQYVEIFVVAFIAGGILFGFSGGTVEAGFWTQFSHEILIRFIFGVTIAFMIGVLTRVSSIAISVGLVLQLAGSLIGMLLATYLPKLYDYYLYSVINLDKLPSGESMTKASIILVVYFIIFMGITFISFNKRDLA